MRTLVALIALLWAATTNVSAQEPGTIPWTLKNRANLERVAISVPSRYSSLGMDPSQNYLFVPRNWTVSVFAAGASVSKPRFMAWGPDSVLYVANQNGNNVLALPDRDKDGVADTVLIAAKGFSLGHDVRFWRDTMFVCQEAGVVKLWRSDESGFTFDKRLTVIDKAAQSNQTGGNHRTRTLVIDTIAMKLYLSVGSRGNADRETNRAVIEEYSYDGMNRRVYALGTRNAVGMTLHPRTGRLWANNNGSDNQGNNIPPEWVDIVRDSGFYGYPIGYHYRNWYPLTSDYQDLAPFTHEDTVRMQRMCVPAALVEAHSAPMALVFSENAAQPAYASGAFMAMRGSWNRTPVSGTKVVFLRFDSDQDTIANEVEDFCTGFITDSTNSATRWGRPVGIAIAGDGSVYVSIDDGKQCILKVSPPTSVSVGATFGTHEVLMPNPANDAVNIQIPEDCILVEVRGLAGNLMHSAVPVHGTHRITGIDWPEGVYLVQLRCAAGTKSEMLVVHR